MKKGNAKRQAILDTAYRLFLAQGYDNTSMSEITTQVGGSKATLYHHFASKEELFVACMTAAIDQHVAGALASLSTDPDDMAMTLRRFGESFLQFVSSSDMVAVRRQMVAEASRLGVGKLFFDKIQTIGNEVALFLSACMASGKLRRDDSVLAANHLRGLLEAEILEPLLLQALETPPDDAEKNGMAQRAVAAFLRAYAPDDSRTLFE
ncbi:TetR/AcrR family transcriptional regulator [Paludibacterium purpuratum]|uniref:TetR family transcriptional regulator n=1 Tax=Paludibacterium purpuratum TaxID=1144873 RepID=A0A4R7B289_9NEIS|nr:TetR/AcrR family transcriptional regulator [Paludibacterium purpuratum]TDR77852.1 TetR family transcriptional regulator [Paludibacterium purpuratum]